MRQRIQTSHIARRLQNHVLGLLELNATQIRAAEILLRKTIPDLSAVAHSGTVELRPEELTDAALAHIAATSGNRAIEAPLCQKEPGELH